MAQQFNDLSRSLAPLEQDSTIIAVIEMSQASWLVAGLVPGIERHPLKKLEPSEVDLLRLLMRWRAEATQKGRTITRIVVAFEAVLNHFEVQLPNPAHDDLPGLGVFFGAERGILLAKHFEHVAKLLLVGRVLGLDGH